jgi:hypothetical protein
MHVAEGTKNVGTARVREDMTVGRDSQQRALARKFGTQPNSEFDDIADGANPFPIVTRPPVIPKRTAKYGNQKCESGGIKFDSKKEMMHWHGLVQRQARGEIRNLELQVPFVLTERQQRDDGTWERASKYVADFVYLDAATGKKVVEDVKSAATRKNRAYVQKRKDMLKVHGITVKEI